MKFTKPPYQYPRFKAVGDKYNALPSLKDCLKRQEYKTTLKVQLIS